MRLATINVTGWQPGDLPHIKAVLQGKHPGKTIIIQHRMGGDVDYLVD